MKTEAMGFFSISEFKGYVFIPVDFRIKARKFVNVLQCLFLTYL